MSRESVGYFYTSDTLIFCSKINCLIKQDILYWPNYCFGVSKTFPRGKK